MNKNTDQKPAAGSSIVCDNDRVCTERRLNVQPTCSQREKTQRAANERRLNVQPSTACHPHAIPPPHCQLPPPPTHLPLPPADDVELLLHQRPTQGSSQPHVHSLRGRGRGRGPRVRGPRVRGVGWGSNAQGVELLLPAPEPPIHYLPPTVPPPAHRHRHPPTAATAATHRVVQVPGQVLPPGHAGPAAVGHTLYSHAETKSSISCG